MVPCSRCGQAIDPTKATYSKQGELVCKGCESADIVTEGYVRAARSTCVGTLGVGLLSVFINPFYIFSIAALVSGVRAVTLINRSEYRTALGRAHGSMLAAAIVGMVAACVQPSLRVLAGVLYAFIH